MRLLHVHAGNLYGGVETLLATLAHNRGPLLDSEFALCFDGRIAAELRACGAAVHSLGGVCARNPLSVMRARRRLLELLRTGDYDAAVCHMPWAQAIFGSVVRRAALPLVFWMHDAATGRHWVERAAQRVRPDLVLCNSAYTASTLPQLYAAVPHAVIFYPVTRPQAVLSANRRLLRAEFATPDDAVVILQAGRMEAWKGHQLHLAALAHLRDIPGWVCWIAGGAQRPAEAAYLETLRAEVQRCGLTDHVRFCGQRSDVARLMRAADIFCQPNAGPEPFGIVFVEALYAALPVVATAIGGACEILDGSCGILVAPGDAAALSSALRGLIGDPAARLALGNAGPDRARQLCDPATQITRLALVLSTHFGASQTRGCRAASPTV